MSRFRKLRRRSRPSSRGAPGARALNGAAPDVLLVPDLSASLTDGVAVRAHVRARLLGVRLLRLDADVVLVPAATLVPAARAAEAPTDSRPGPVAISSDDPRCLWYARRLLLESEDVLDGVSLDPSLPTPRRA